MKSDPTLARRERASSSTARVYLYAAKKPGKMDDFERARLRSGNLSTGVLVGTVEVVDCTGEPGAYEWHLANPERLSKLLKPERHPLPA